MEENVNISKKIFTIDEIKNIATPILKKYGIKKAYLFGSYARGVATELSDIDIMISNNNFSLLGLSKNKSIIKLQTDLEKALGKKIDLIIDNEGKNTNNDEYSKIAEDIFYKQVSKDKKLIY